MTTNIQIKSKNYDICHDVMTSHVEAMIKVEKI